MISGENLNEFLLKLTKVDLQKFVDKYNALALIFNENKINTTKNKKDVIISKILAFKENYYKFLIQSLDLEDFNLLKFLLLKKSNNDFLNEHREFINYLIDSYVIFKNDDLIIPRDIYYYLKNLVKNKTIFNYVKSWNRIYKLADGIIIAYGVVDRKYFDIIISGIVEKELIIPKLEFYYKREYIIDSKKIYSNKLTNKKRINKYFKDNNYKLFTNKEYVLLGNSLFHHNIKCYKRFIKMLKNNYIFKNSDINYVDKNIVIPYLYNSLNEEDVAKSNLEKTIIDLFEFKSDKLKLKMLDGIMKIRDEFPLWEYRGYSKIEVKK